MFDFQLKYLIERENEEFLRPEARSIALPGQSPQRVEAYRLIWRWWDRLLDYAVDLTEEEFMTYVQKAMDDHNESIEAALPRAVSDMVYAFESLGMDITDDNIAGLVAKRAQAR